MSRAGAVGWVDHAVAPHAAAPRGWARTHIPAHPTTPHQPHPHTALPLRDSSEAVGKQPFDGGGSIAVALSQGFLGLGAKTFGGRLTILIIILITVVITVIIFILVIVIVVILTMCTSGFRCSSRFVA